MVKKAWQARVNLGKDLKLLMYTKGRIVVSQTLRENWSISLGGRKVGPGFTLMIIRVECFVSYARNGRENTGVASKFEIRYLAFVLDQTVLRHEQSDQHKEAVELEKAKQRSERDGGIVHSFDKVWEAEKNH